MHEDKYNFEDFKDIFLTHDEYENITAKFIETIKPYLEENKNKMIVPKGLPEIHSFSTTFGEYKGKQLGLYIIKNSKKVADLDLSDFYLKLDEELIKKEGEKIEWRTNLHIDKYTKQCAEVEFIPMAFEGSFLYETLQTSEHPISDFFFLIHGAVMRIGKIFSEIINEKGFSSSYPRIIKDKDEMNLDQFARETNESDFHVELRFIEKCIFLTNEEEILNTYSESPLETKIGLELIRECIPFLVQYDIKKDFPNTESKKRLISKPDFFIFSPYGQIAIFCDSKKYHDRKKDQSLKDKRIDRKLQKMGIIVLRFTDEEINDNLENCIEEIKEHYLGEEYALSNNDVFLKKIYALQSHKISEWEQKFIDSLAEKLHQDKDISLKEERILNQICGKNMTGASI